MSNLFEKFFANAGTKDVQNATPLTTKIQKYENGLPNSKTNTVKNINKNSFLMSVMFFCFVF